MCRGLRQLGEGMEHLLKEGKPELPHQGRRAGRAWVARERPWGAHVGLPRTWGTHVPE